MSLRSVSMRGWMLAGLGLLGCGSSEREPISAQQLALTAEENVEHALRGAHAAGSFIADSTTLAHTLSSVTGSNCAPVASAPCPAGTACPLTPEPTCTDSVTTSDLQQTRQDMSDAIDKLLKSLKEEVFIPQNLESEDGHTAVYRLGAEYLCKGSASSSPGAPLPAPGTTPTPTPEPVEPTLDPDCVANAEKLAPRLRLSSPSDGEVDVALLLTDARHNPATLELGTDRVGVMLDLGEIKASLDAAGEDTGNLEAMRGKLELELKRNAELDYSFRVNVLSTLGLTTIDDLAEKVAFTLAGHSPSFEIRLDGNARRITGTYDIGSLDVSGPLNAFRDSFASTEYDASGKPLPQKTYTGMIEALLGGLNGSVVLDGNQDKLELKGLGLGDVSSTLKLDGTTLAQLDLNADAGRHFDLTITHDSDDSTTLAFAPKFDLSVLLNFAPLTAQINDIPDAYLSEKLHLWFDGQNPSVRAEPKQIRALSGTLNLTSEHVPAANLSVPQGSCLVASDASAPTHPLLGAYSVGACQ